MYEDPKSKISQLERVLDAREDRVTGRIKRHELHDRQNSVSQDWAADEFKVNEEVAVDDGPKRKSLATKILIGSIIFFLLALGVAAYKFMGGGNIVSGNNIAVTVRAPLSVVGGETVPLEIEIKNNNNVTLTGADLGVTFPAGAKEVEDTSLSAKRLQVFLGDIAPNQSVKKNLTVVLFGQENEKKDITLTLEYKVAGSNSQFNKTKIVSILISASPVSVSVTGPTEVNTNQTVDFSIDVLSNSPTVIKNLLLQGVYPSGFSFLSSNPQIFSKNNLWQIGDLEPGAKRTIKLRGLLTGQEGEERGFTFSLGTVAAGDNLAIDVPLASSFSSVTIRRPFVSADIFLNETNSAEYVSGAGSKVETMIKWRNNLAYEVADVSLQVKISGNSFNKASVQVDGGLYRSLDNTIVFNKATDKTLARLAPGQEGSSKFTFNSFGVGTVTGSSLSNPSITVEVSVKGRRTDYADGPEDVLFSDTRRVKLTADPQLSAKALYFVGPFKNTGPIPPRAEQETTYTVTWTVTNPLNNLSGATVSAVLPPYIKWLGVVSPEREKMDYDAGTGAIVWNIGTVVAGAGTIAPAREISFQISLLPSVDKIGSTPDLVGEAKLTAKDTFTLTSVADSFAKLDTRLNSDPYFKADAEKVIQ